MTQEFYITKLTSSNKTGKLFWLESAELKTKSVLGYETLRAVREQHTLESLAQMIRESSPNDSLMSGLADEPVLNLHAGFMKRSNENFPHRTCGSLLVIDCDYKNIQPADVLTTLRSLHPALEGAGAVVCTSTGSNILNAETGETLRGINGSHIFIPVDDGTQIPRILRWLDIQLYLRGFGKMEVKDSGFTFIKTLVDTHLKVPSQPCLFRAHLGEGLAQDKQVDVVQGAMLCAADIPALSEEDNEAYQRKARDEFNSVKEQVAVARKGFIRRKITQDVSKGIDRFKSETKWTRVASKNLPEDFVIETEIGSFTVGEILRKKSNFHEVRCKDPIDDSREVGVAIIYTQQAQPIIFSFLRGNTRFSLGSK